jgi:hypothetical protein
VFLNDHVAEIDADPKPDPPLVRHLQLTVDHTALDISCAAHGIHDTRKFR